MINNLDSKTVIFLVRHGDTHSGKEIFWSRKLGRSLKKIGVKQAEKAGEYLSEFSIEYIYHSPLKRTTQTAGIIRQFLPKAKIAASKSLLEWDIGFNGERIEGKPFEYYFSQGIEEMYDKTPIELVGGELLVDAAKRISNFITKTVKMHPQKYIVCVSHEDVIRSAVLYLENKDLNKLSTFPCKKGSIYKLCFDSDKLTQVEYIDSHLDTF